MEKQLLSSDSKILPIPVEDLPSAWWDEEEIRYFFSPFRSYDQNPDDKDNKIKFWKPIVFKWCEHQKKCAFTVSELERDFTKNQLVPACLCGVIEDMLRKRQICTREDFLLIPPQTWSGWALDFLVKRPLSWSLKKAKEIIIKSDADEMYVLMEAVQFQARFLLSEQQKSGNGPLLSRNEVQQLIPCMKDLDIVLHWLLCKNKIACVKFKEQELIKFCGIEERCSIITETDIGIYVLQNTERTLCHNLEELEAKRLSAIDSAKSYVAKGMKQMAKSSLRKKKQIEKTLDKRATVLENVQTLLAQIHDSDSDSKIIETYQHGLAALKFSLKEANLTDDNVSNTMLELNEVIDFQRDIQDSMSQNIGDISSDQELEEELSKLLLTELVPVPNDKPVTDDLPEVPSGKIVAPTITSKKVCM